LLAGLILSHALWLAGQARIIPCARSFSQVWFPLFRFQLGKDLDVVSEKKAKDYFKRFVEKWNKKKLPQVRSNGGFRLLEIPSDYWKSRRMIIYMDDLMNALLTKSLFLCALCENLGIP